MLKNITASDFFAVEMGSIVKKCFYSET